MSAAPKRRPAGGLKPISIIGKRPVDKLATVRPTKRGPQAFPLRNTPPPDVTSEDEREAEEEAKRQEERRKRKKRDRVLAEAEAGKSSVLKDTGRQGVKKSKVERKEEEERAVGGGTKPRKQAVPPPAPHVRESKCDSAGPSRVEGKAAKDRVQARLRGDPSSPPPLGALLRKTKGGARQAKAGETPIPFKKRIDPLDRWASVTDSPDPLELSAIAAPAKKAGFPLPDPTTTGADAFPLPDLTPTGKRIRRIVSPSPDGVNVMPRVGDGHAFFESFGKVSEEAGDSGEMQIIDHSIHDPLNPLEDDEDDLEEDEEQLKADRLYADKFKGPNICPYCSERMPADPSPYLTSLEKRLHDLSMSDPGTEPIRKLDWKQYSEFCALHEAETTTIPLGLRDGFPGSIDFVAIEGRLTNGDWLSAELTAIAEDPYRSALFEIVLSDIARMGKTQWGGINHQSNRRTVGLSLPGYYGLMGRAVLHRHFQNLMKWGFLAALASTSAAPSPIHPLSTQEFISHVLIPEAAILLVMQDQGWSRGTSRPEDWDDRRAEAFQIWRGSTEYGRYRFREDGEEAEVVYSQLEEIYPETRRKLEESRLSKSIEDEEGSESSRGASGTSVGEQHDIGLAAPSSSFGDGDWGEEALMQISTLADRAELSYRSGSNAASEGKRGRVACG